MKQDRRSFFKFFGAAASGAVVAAKAVSATPATPAVAEVVKPMTITAPPLPPAPMLWSIDPNMCVTSTGSMCFSLPRLLNINIGLHGRGVQ